MLAFSLRHSCGQILPSVSVDLLLVKFDLNEDKHFLTQTVGRVSSSVSLSACLAACLPSKSSLLFIWADWLKHLGSKNQLQVSSVFVRLGVNMQDCVHFELLSSRWFTRLICSEFPKNDYNIKSVCICCSRTKCHTADVLLGIPEQVVQWMYNYKHFMGCLWIGGFVYIHWTSAPPLPYSVHVGAAECHI